MEVSKTKLSSTKKINKEFFFHKFQQHDDEININDLKDAEERLYAQAHYDDSIELESPTVMPKKIVTSIRSIHRYWQNPKQNKNVSP